MHTSLDREGTRVKTLGSVPRTKTVFLSCELRIQPTHVFPETKRRGGETRSVREGERDRQKQVSHARECPVIWCKRVRVNGARYATRTRRVRLAQPADYSNTTEERPQWDGSLNATMLPPVWVERAGSESARLGRARPLSDLVDMPIDTVYMSMDMPCRSTLSYASKLYYSLLSSLFRLLSSSLA